jgi:hypothetical protein
VLGLSSTTSCQPSLPASVMSWRIFAHATMMAQCPQEGDAGSLMPHIRRRDDDLDWERGTSCRHCRHSSPSTALNFQTVMPLFWC